MAEIDGEGGQEPRPVPPCGVPRLQTPDGEGVAQGMQAGPAATIGWPQAQSPGQTGEPLVQQPGALEAAALRDQEGVRARVIAEILALEAIVAKGRGRRRMKRHDPRFAELGLENAQV